MTIAQELMGQINEGIEWRRLSSGGREDSSWRAFGLYYQCDWDKLSLSSLGYIPVNRAFSFIRNKVPRIYFKNPKVTVLPMGNPSSKLVELIDNELIRILKIKRLIKRSLTSAFVYGTAVVKDGYDLAYFGDKDNNNQYDTNVRGGFPWAVSCDPVDISVPYGSKRFDNLPWVAHRTIRRLTDIKANKNIKGIDKLSAIFIAEDGSTSKNVVRQSTGEKNNYRSEFCELWEFYDRRNQRIYLLSEGFDEPHWSAPYPELSDKIPFNFLTINDSVNSCWGISPLKVIEPQILELNDLRTELHKARRLTLLKLLFKEQAFDESDIKELTDASKIRTAIPVKGGGSLADSVYELKTNIPYEFFNVGEMIEGDIRTDSGSGKNQSGEVSSGRRTAQEVSIVRESSEVTNDDVRDLAGDLFIGIINNINSTVIGRWEQPEIIALLGDVGKMYDASKLKLANTFLSINPEDARPVNSQTLQQDAIALYRELGQHPLVNPYAPVTALLEAFGVDIMRYLDPRVRQSVEIVFQQIAQQQQAAQASSQPAEGEQGA